MVNENMVGKKRGPKLGVSDLEKRASNVDEEVKKAIQSIIQAPESKTVSVRSDLTPKIQGKPIDLISSSTTSQLRTKPDPTTTSTKS
jgi:hypothetical protein